MKNEQALAFARAPAAILFQAENDNMWGDWEDYILATRNKRGVYAVIGRKYSDEYLDGKTRKSGSAFSQLEMSGIQRGLFRR